MLFRRIDTTTRTRLVDAEPITITEKKDLETSILRNREIAALKESWSGTLTPKFPEEIVGKQYVNIMEAMESNIFWELANELLGDEQVEIVNTKLSFSFIYHQSSCFAKAIKIAMISIDNLDNLDDYFRELGSTHLRVFNAQLEMFEYLQVLVIELLKMSFVDAFDVKLQYCWKKFIKLIISKMVDSIHDLVLKDALHVYANENALLATTIIDMDSVQRKIDFNDSDSSLPSQAAFSKHSMQSTPNSSVNSSSVLVGDGSSSFTTPPSTPVQKPRHSFITAPSRNIDYSPKKQKTEFQSSGTIIRKDSYSTFGGPAQNSSQTGSYELKQKPTGFNKALMRFKNSLMVKKGY